MSPGPSLLYRCDNVRLYLQARQGRYRDAERHARARWGDRGLRDRDRHGRTRLRDRPRSDRAALAKLYRDGREREQALYQQGAARMLPAGCRAFRLVPAQSRAPFDARGPRADRLGDGERHLGSRNAPNQRPRRSDDRRQARGRVRDRRHRHRHRHDPHADRRGRARPRDGGRHGEDRRLGAADSVSSRADR